MARRSAMRGGVGGEGLSKRHGWLGGENVNKNTKLPSSGRRPPRSLPGAAIHWTGALTRLRPRRSRSQTTQTPPRSGSALGGWDGPSRCRGGRRGPRGPRRPPPAPCLRPCLRQCQCPSPPVCCACRPSCSCGANAWRSCGSRRARWGGGGNGRVRGASVDGESRGGRGGGGGITGSNRWTEKQGGHNGNKYFRSRNGTRRHLFNASYSVASPGLDTAPLCISRRRSSASLFSDSGGGGVGVPGGERTMGPADGIQAGQRRT